MMLIKDFKSSEKPKNFREHVGKARRAKPTSWNKSQVEKLHLEICSSILIHVIPFLLRALLKIHFHFNNNYKSFSPPLSLIATFFSCLQTHPPKKVRGKLHPTAAHAKKSRLHQTWNIFKLFQPLGVFEVQKNWGKNKSQVQFICTKLGKKMLGDDVGIHMSAGMHG